MKKYYIKAKNGVIITLGSAKKVPSSATEITKAEYDNYMDILNGIEERVGYTKNVTLYIDGTYNVEYIPIVEIEEEA